MEVILKDTTFRDGIQQRGIEATEIPEVLRAIKAIDNLGIHYHEVGFAVSDEASRERIRAACCLDLQGKISAFGRTHRSDVQALIDLKVPVGTLVGKTRSNDAVNGLRVDLDRNLSLISESVSALVSSGIEVIYDAEHAFQAFLEDDSSYALQTLEAALVAGAKWLVLCDTNGKMKPTDISEVLNMVKDYIPIEQIGIHTHNDRGRAIANAEIALSFGIGLFEGTIGGFGERTGNMDLCNFMANAHFDFNVENISPSHLKVLRQTYLFICDVLNTTPQPNLPWVGENAFYTEAGMHQSGNARIQGNYFHADPEIVGNKEEVGVTNQSGRANLSTKASEFGFDIQGEQLDEVARVYQKLVDFGGDFGLADASFYLWLLRQIKKMPENLPEFVYFRAIVEKKANQEVTTEASLRLRIKGERKLFNADGDGPVNALDEVLRRTLRRRYPDLMHVRLNDFKVRIVDSGRGTAAKVRVRISFIDGIKSWTTMAVHENIIEASWEALWDGYMYKLVVNGSH